MGFSEITRLEVLAGVLGFICFVLGAVLLHFYIKEETLLLLVYSIISLSAGMMNYMAIAVSNGIKEARKVKH